MTVKRTKATGEVYTFVDDDLVGNIDAMLELVGADQQDAELDRVKEAGLAVHSEGEDHCCYAYKDEGWIDGIDGHRWEIYTVLADAETAGHLEAGGEGNDVECCAPAEVLVGGSTESASCC